jgi:hypothetical protein
VNSAEPHRVIVTSKPYVAAAQLETAIRLWFADGDPVSIHTLAAASHDCFHALSKMAGRPSLFKVWLKTQSKAAQRRATDAQNFFKHGYRDLSKRCSFMPFYAELLMFDAAVCYEHLAGGMTPIMETFTLRFSISNPRFLNVDVGALLESKGLEIDEIAPLGRAEFLQKILPIIARGVDV